jgi:hypothetical protein
VIPSSRGGAMSDETPATEPIELEIFSDYV